MLSLSCMGYLKAQSSSFTTFQLSSSTQRFDFEWNSNEEIIDLCNLEIGTSYELLMVSGDFGKENPFKYEVISGAEVLVNNNKLQIQATEDCVLLKASLEGINNPFTPFYTYFSVARLGDSPTKKIVNGPDVVPLEINPNFTPQQLIEDIFIGGGCFDVFNIQPIGGTNSDQGRGYFSSGFDGINLMDGVILSTGNVVDAPGPNTSESIGSVLGGGGDPDLDLLGVGNVNDVVGIEFDFTPTIDQIEFRYVFASEEYCEFVNTPFNDVFGFFISGPGINGTFTNNAENIALLPNGDPTTISNVNHLTNSGFFRANDVVGINNCNPFPAQSPNDVEYDGFTVVLVATAQVIPCETYHIRLVIGDISDGAYDSAVFLQGNSFEAGGEASVNVASSITGNNIIYEDCGEAVLTFAREDLTDISMPLEVNYTIDPASTATPGVDYTAIPNPVIIPPGQTSVDIPISAFQDGIIEGTENIILQLESSCNCLTGSAEILIQETPPLVADMADQELCGPQPIVLSPTTSGGVPPFTYQWSTGDTGPTLSVIPDQNTTYSVTISDECGDEVTTSVDITVLDIPTAFLSGDGVICNNISEVPMTVTFTGGGPWDLFYTINGAVQTPILGITENPFTFMVSEVGTVELFSVGTGPCDGFVDGVGTVGLVQIFPVIVPVPTSCEGASNGFIELFVTGGLAPYEYLWNDGNTWEDPQEIMAGDYSVTITDGWGCTETAEATVDDGPPFIAEAAEDIPISCFGGADGAAIVDVTSGGSGDYDYEWSSGGTEQTETGLEAGTYIITVTDLFLCQDTDTITLEAPEAIETSLTGNSPIDCSNPNGGSIDMDVSGGSGGYTFAWSNGSTDQNPTGVSPGIYYVTVTDANNCTTLDSVEVTGSFDLPTAIAEAPSEITCTDAVVNLSGDGSSSGTDFTYQWSTNDGNIVSGGTTLDPEVDQDGSYVLIVTNQTNGCTSTDTVSVSENLVEPTAEAGLTQELNCDNNTLLLDGGGSSTGTEFTYNWTTNNGNILSGETTLTPEVDDPGLYTIEVLDTTNGCSATDVVTITEDVTVPEAEASVGGQLTCDVTELQLSGVGSSVGLGTITYLWTTNNGNIVSGANTLLPLVNEPGTYTLLVTDTDNGCTATASVNVSEDLQPPAVNIAAPDVLTCDITEISLSGAGSGAGTYLWTTTDGVIISGANTLNPTIGSTGTYTLEVTSSLNGCTAQSSVTVTDDVAPPVAEAGNPDTLTCTTTFLSLDGSASSSNGNFTYSWSTTNGNIIIGVNTTAPLVSEPGDYQILVTNQDNGCTATDVVTIGEDVMPPVSDAGNEVTLNCTDPSLSLDGSNSSAGNEYTYEWTTPDGNILNGETTVSPEVDALGTYNLLVTNQLNGCTATSSVNVNEDFNAPAASASVNDVLDCATTDLSVEGTGSSTGNNITYAWTTIDGNIVSGADAINAQVDDPGTYELLVTNLTNGCTNTATVEVQEDLTPPEVVIETPGILNCITTSFVLDGSNSDAGTYQWTTSDGQILDGDDTTMPEIGSIGTYTLVVTSALTGCTAEASVEIQEDTNEPTADAGVTQVVNCTNPQILLDGTASSSNGNFSYLWTTANGIIESDETTLEPVISAAGDYELLVTNDDNGCTATASVNITDDFDEPAVEAGNMALLTCTQTTVVLDGTGSSSGSDFTYEWTSAGGNILDGINTLNPEVGATGTYTLIVTDQTNGCTASDDVEVEAGLGTPTAIAGPDQTLTCVVSEVTLDGSASSIGNNYTYEWSTTDGSIISGANSLNPVVDQEGIYELLVTNTDNGCTAVSFADVFLNNEPPAINIPQPDVLTCTQQDAIIDASNSDNGPEYVYQWTTLNGNIISGDTTPVLLVGDPGDYELLITNTSTGCFDQTAITVVDNLAPPTANAGLSDTITCAAPEITINADATSPGAGLTIEWTTTDGLIESGDDTTTPVVSAPGTYQLLVTNTDNGCTATSEVAIGEDVAIPVIDVVQPDIINCYNPEIIIDGNASSSGAEFTYEWTSPNGNIVNGENTPSPAVDAPGDYELLITDQSNGCSLRDTFNVQDDVVAPVAVSGNDGVLDCAIESLNLDGTGSSSGTDFEYIWSTTDGSIIDGETTLNPEIDAPGTYVLLVTDISNGCVDSSDVLIAASTDIPDAVALVSDTLTCDVLSLNLNGLGSSIGSNISYTWTTTDGNIVSGQNSLDPLVDQPGEYTLTVLNSVNSCTNIATIEVIQDIQAPAADAGNDQLLNCAVTSLSLDGSQSSAGALFEYDWSPVNNGNIVSGETSLAPEVDQPGLYSLVVRNNYNGCSTTDTVFVDQDIAQPDVEAGSSETITCSVPSIIIDGDGDQGAEFTYQWSTDGGNIVSGENSLTPEVDLPGIYTLVITNNDNFCVSVDSVEIDIDDVLPTAIAGVVTTSELTCDIQELTLDGTSSSQGAQFTYLWSVTATSGNIVSGETSLNPVVDDFGAYELLVTNTSNGCTATASVDITEDITPPAADAGLGGTLTCAINSIQLDASANTSAGSDFDYQWSTGIGVIQSGGTSLTPVVAAPGDYQLLVTNTYNGCTTTSSVSIDQDDDVPVANAGQDGLLTCAVTSLDLDGSGSSSYEDLTYLWTTNNGNIVNGETTLSPTIDGPGAYLLTVLDTSNNCMSTSDVIVSLDDTHPDINFGNPDILTCETTAIPLDATNSTNGNDYAYLWSTSDGQIDSGITSLEPTVSEPGTYTLEITNTFNGCVTVDSLDVGQDTELPMVDPGVTAELTCILEDYLLGGTGTSVGPNFEYSWTTDVGNFISAQDGLNALIDAPGTYTLTVLNTSTGCEDEASVPISQNNEIPQLSLSGGDIINCYNPVSNLQVSVTSGNTDFNYTWNTANGVILTGQGTEEITMNEDGNYSVFVLDNYNGCTNDISQLVEKDTIHPSAEAGISFELTCIDTLITLDGTSSSSGPEFVYEWSTTDGNIVSGSDAQEPVVNLNGTYNLLVTNTENGCTAEDITSVIANNDVPVADAGASLELNCFLPVQDLDGSGSTQGPLFDYLWTTTSGNIVSDETTLSPTIDEDGTYTLLVVNSDNGCQDTDEVNITSNFAEPTAIIAAVDGDVLTCDINSLQLDGSTSTPVGQVSFDWATTDGNITGNTDVSVIDLNQTGEYALMVTDIQNGCTNMTTYDITIDTLVPIANIIQPEILTCDRTTVNVDGSGSSTGSNLAYQWSGGNIVSGQGTIEITVDQSTVYTLLVENTTNGCTSQTSTNVGIDTISPLAVAAALDEFDCVTDQVDLSGDGSSAGPNYNYNWSTVDGSFVSGTQSLRVIVDEPTTYTLVVKDLDNGCTQSADVLVPENTNVPTGISLDVIDPNCFGDTGGIEISEVDGGEGPYAYSVDGGNNFFTAQLLDGLEPGVYDIVVQDVIGCEYTSSFEVPQIPALDVTAEPEVTVGIGQTEQLFAQVNFPEEEIARITWTPEVYLSCADCFDPIIENAQVNTFYTVEVETEGGCIATAEVLLRVIKERDVFIPNVFTPFATGGDNDLLMIFANSEQVEQINYFEIFDRWGNRVFGANNFQPNDPAYSWDGTFRGEELNPGVFVYIAEILFKDGETIIYKGSVTIAR